MKWQRYWAGYLILDIVRGRHVRLRSATAARQYREGIPSMGLIGPPPSTRFEQAYQQGEL